MPRPGKSQTHRDEMVAHGLGSPSWLRLLPHPTPTSVPPPNPPADQTQVTSQHRVASETFVPMADPRDPIYVGGRQTRNKTSELPPWGFHRLASVHSLRWEGRVDSLRDSVYGQSSLAR